MSNQYSSGNIFLADVRNNVDRFSRGKKRNHSPVGVKAQIPVISHNVNRVSPSRVGVRGCTSRPCVVDRADVYTGESNSRKGLKHLTPGGKRFRD
jgi:hypothetical protein